MDKDLGYQFECKKDGLRQTQDGGVKVTFNINPVDMPKELYTDFMGQRYIAVIVPINDDETPRLARTPPTPHTDANKPPIDTGKSTDKPVSRIKAFKALVNDAEFEEYYSSLPSCVYLQDTAELWVKKSICNIGSSKELEDNDDAWNRFLSVRNKFHNWRRAKQQEEHYGV